MIAQPPSLHSMSDSEEVVLALSVHVLFVCVSCHRGQTDRYVDQTSGMKVKWKDMWVRIKAQGHMSKVKGPHMGCFKKCKHFLYDIEEIPAQIPARCTLGPKLSQASLASCQASHDSSNQDHHAPRTL